MKRLITLVLMLVVGVFVLAGCGSENGQGGSDKKENKQVTIGVTAGPHAEVMDFVKAEAAKKGIDIKVVEFNDYVQPNIALSQKELDMNSFQHQPYLDNMIKDRGLKLVSIGKSILTPMGLYSKTVKNVNDVPEGGIVAIPNDPTNGGRALLVLQQAGLIKLKEGVGVKATVSDIVSNPKNLKIQELDAAQLPRSLQDVSLGAINTNYALSAGLNPQKDALFIEDKNSQYANVIVVREEDKTNPLYLEVVKIYQSEPVKQFINEHFKGSVIPAF